jgi:adenosine deaminase
MMVSAEFIKGVPKVELHLHIEGTLEPSLLMALAERNNVPLEHNSVEEIHAAYKFNDLGDFLKLYYQGMEVLIQEQDFFDLTWTYLERVHTNDNVRHVELFFDPQPHLHRGVAFDVVVNGIHRACVQAKTQFDMSSKLLMCFVRHMPIDDAFRTLELACQHKDKISGVGLDSTEQGNHPEKYVELFDAARAHGFHTVAHAGEEGPADYVRGAVELLKVQRVDHGVRCYEDPEVVQLLKREKIPLTMCPISNICLCIFPKMADHNIKKLLDLGVCVTINSDDPAYFGGYITDNYQALADEPTMKLTQADVIHFAQNGIDASFLDDAGKTKLTNELNDYVKQNSLAPME